jgi:predicted N-acetyltransferase YhbS
MAAAEKENKMIQIQHAKKEDINHIYLFGKSVPELAFSKKFVFHQKKEIEEAVKNKKENILIIAKDNNQVIGFLLAKILSNVTAGWCMLDNLAVKKEYRKHGRQHDAS